MPSKSITDLVRESYDFADKERKSVADLAYARVGGLPSRVTPLDHGAVGDGANNDAGAFVKAWNELGTRGGGELFLPPGYRWRWASLMTKDWLNLASDITIRGSGSASPILFDTYAAGGVALTFRNMITLSFENVAFASKQTASMVDMNYGMELAADNGQVFFNKCTFYGLTCDNAIIWAHDTHLTMRDCQFIACAGLTNFGRIIHLSAYAGGVFEGCRLWDVGKENNKDHSIDYTGRAWILAENPYASGGAQAIRQLVIRDCSFDEGVTRLIEVKSTNTAPYGRLGGLKIERCSFNSASSNIADRCAIYLNHVDNVEIQDVRIGVGGTRTLAIDVVNCGSVLLKRVKLVAPATTVNVDATSTSVVVEDSTISTLTSSAATTITRRAVDVKPIKAMRVSTGSVLAGVAVEVTATWPTAFSNANYTVNVNVLEGTAGTNTLRYLKTVSKTTTQVVVRIINDDTLNARTGELHIVGIPDA